MRGISVIIPTKNRLDLLTQCWESIKTSIPQWRKLEVIIVDTGSDGTSDWASKQGLVTEGYPGATFAQACNAGARVATGSKLWLLNNDLIIKSDLLSTWSESEAAIQGAKLLHPRGWVNHAGIGFDLNGCPWPLWKMAPANMAPVVLPHSVAAVTFACVQIKRWLWEILEGLDEIYTNAFEDVDFCLRAASLGERCWYEPWAVAIHLEGQTEGRYDHDAESWAHFRGQWLDTGRLWDVLGLYPVQLQGARA